MRRHVDPARVVSARKRAGFTQESLAVCMGIRERTISSWEAGRHTPQPRLLAALSEATGVPEADFYLEVEA